MVINRGICRTKLFSWVQGRSRGRKSGDRFQEAETLVVRKESAKKQAIAQAQISQAHKNMKIMHLIMVLENTRTKNLL